MKIPSVSFFLGGARCRRRLGAIRSSLLLRVWATQIPEVVTPRINIIVESHGTDKTG